jgi:hypothetical protein
MTPSRLTTFAAQAIVVMAMAMANIKRLCVAESCRLTFRFSIPSTRPRDSRF